MDAMSMKSVKCKDLIDIDRLMTTHVNFCSRMQKVKVLKAQKT